MSWLTTPVMGWLELASNAFYYLIGSAVSSAWSTDAPWK